MQQPRHLHEVPSVHQAGRALAQTLRQCLARADYLSPNARYVLLYKESQFLTQLEAVEAASLDEALLAFFLENKDDEQLEIATYLQLSPDAKRKYVSHFPELLSHAQGRILRFFEGADPAQVEYVLRCAGHMLTEDKGAPELLEG